MNERISLRLLDADPTIADTLREPLSAKGINLVAADATIDPILASAAHPSVLVLDSSASPQEPAAAVRRILAQAPEVCIIVTGSGVHPTAISRAVTAGARGFLLKPYAPADLASTVHEALETTRALGRSRPPAQARQAGKVIAVYSPKGGVGTSTIATNLAVALAQRPGSNVAIVDADLQFGDVGTIMDLRSANSIADVIGHSPLDRSLIDETFVRHRSGVHALLAPDSLDVLGEMEAPGVVQMLDDLSAHFDHIVCDLWSSLEDLTMGVMKRADAVVLVTTPEVPALRSLQRVLAATREELHLDRRAVVAANRYPAKTGVTADEMARVLGVPVAATIPSEGIGVTEAINRGLTMFDPSARTRLGRHYSTLANTVLARLEHAAPAHPRTARQLAAAQGS